MSNVVHQQLSDFIRVELEAIGISHIAMGDGRTIMTLTGLADTLATRMLASAEESVTTDA